MSYKYNYLAFASDEENIINKLSDIHNCLPIEVFEEVKDFILILINVNNDNWQETIQNLASKLQEIINDGVDAYDECKEILKTLIVTINSN